MFFIYSICLMLLAGLPVWMFYRNLKLFLPATSDSKLLEQASFEKISILIPARNEAASIGAAIDCVLENRAIHFELLILDDQSEDDTAATIRQRIATPQPNSKIRLIESIPLPAGWNGKQHACWRLAEAAQFDWLLFLDADVRLSEDAIQRLVAESLRTQVSLLSGFPYQETGSIAEKMLIPLMHYILLGYLPIHQLRTSTSPQFSAGCGQLMLARRDAYFACDGHRSIRASRHDGIQLPRAFRLKGLTTDVFDASDIATCRMYRNRREVVQGLLKNASEGIANPKLIFVFTVLLIGASVLPIPSLIFAWRTEQSRLTMTLLLIASLCVFIPRLLAAARFRQSLLGTILHPAAVVWFLGLQWLAWIRSMRGIRVAWRGRYLLL